MSFDAATLFRLLPAIHRIRDAEIAAHAPDPLTVAERARLATLAALSAPTAAEQAELAALQVKAGGPLAALLAAFAAEFAVVEENLAQLYDDLFIETCADWAIPYVGDLIAYEPLHALGQAHGLARAEVAHTIALRRRKGTATVLEQLARDVTGFPARAVEFFERLGATQYMNHLRPHCLGAPDLRRFEPLARIGTAFDSVAHTVDVRRIESGRGRFNIPNVGIFLWRLQAHRLRQSPAVRVDGRRYLVSPLGHPLHLFTNPLAEDEIAHLAEPHNVPEPILRRVLAIRPHLYYGTRATATAAADNADPSVVLYVEGAEVPRDAIHVCNLADSGAGWAHEAPAGQYAIDPVLGRIAVAADLPEPERVTVTFHHGFSADLGGGEYRRPVAADAPGTTVLRVPTDHGTIGAALAALGGSGVVEVEDSGRYAEVLAVSVPANGHVVLRAAEGARPTLVLGGELVVTGGADSALTLEGMLVVGEQVRVPDAAGNLLARLRIAHATLVPGLTLDAAGDATSPGTPSLSVERAGVTVEVERAITGALRVAPRARLVAIDSIVDANGPELVAFAAPDDVSPGGELSLIACTVIGKVAADVLELVSNSILSARAAPADLLPPVFARRRQQGCVRYSYLPFTSLVPRRHRCQPRSAGANVAPCFTSQRYGEPAYCQLRRTTPDEVRRGADDESEMGAFHLLFLPQRESNLLARLREYLRVGLAAGVLYET